MSIYFNKSFYALYNHANVSTCSLNNIFLLHDHLSDMLIAATNGVGKREQLINIPAVQYVSDRSDHTLLPAVLTNTSTYCTYY